MTISSIHIVRIYIEFWTTWQRAGRYEMELDSIAFLYVHSSKLHRIML